MLPRAIREDHDPLKWLAGVGTLTFFAFLRWTDFRCPYCKVAFRRTYLPRKVTLGSGERTCPSCGRVFDDGSREWPELGPGLKIEHLFPTPAMGIIGGVLICLILVLALGFVRQVDWPVFVWLSGGLFLFMLLLLAIRMPGIRRSMRRYKNEQDSTRHATARVECKH